MNTLEENMYKMHTKIKIYALEEDLKDLNNLIDNIQNEVSDEYQLAIISKREVLSQLKILESLSSDFELNSLATLNIYQFGFFKYWKYFWLEKYFIDCSDINLPTSIDRIKKVLKKNVNLEEDLQFLEAKEKYLKSVDSCTTVEDLENLKHWYQTSINLSIKKLDLIDY